MHEVLKGAVIEAGIDDGVNFEVLITIDKVRRGAGEVWAMIISFMIGQ